MAKKWTKFRNFIHIVGFVFSVMILLFGLLNFYCYFLISQSPSDFSINIIAGTIATVIGMIGTLFIVSLILRE